MWEGHGCLGEGVEACVCALTHSLSCPVTHSPTDWLTHGTQVCTACRFPAGGHLLCGYMIVNIAYVNYNVGRDRDWQGGWVEACGASEPL